MSGGAWSATFGAAGRTPMQVYDDLMGPRMFGPWAELLLDELALAPGDALLDVACGPGSVTRPAAARVGPGGRVVGCDLSAAMLAVAQAKPPVADGAPIAYHEAPAERLPVEDAAFDVATCQQGLQFFPDKPAALHELHRALRPGGRIGIAVWLAIDACPPFAALADAVEAVLGPEPATRYRGGPWGFPDGRALGALLGEAGFADVRVQRRTLPVAFEGGPAQLAATLATTPLMDVVCELSDADSARLAALVADRLGDGPIASQLASNLAFATRPKAI